MRIKKYPFEKMPDVFICDQEDETRLVFENSAKTHSIEAVYADGLYHIVRIDETLPADGNKALFVYERGEDFTSDLFLDILREYNFVVSLGPLRYIEEKALLLIVENRDPQARFYVDGGYSNPALFDMIIFVEDTLYLLNDNYYPGSGGGGISYDVTLKIHASEISVIRKLGKKSVMIRTNAFMLTIDISGKGSVDALIAQVKRSKAKNIIPHFCDPKKIPKVQDEIVYIEGEEMTCSACLFEFTINPIARPTGILMGYSNKEYRRLWKREIFCPKCNAIQDRNFAFVED